MSSYVMAEKTKIGVYDNSEFRLLQQWNIPANSANDSDIQILFMAVSDDQMKIGIVLGRIKIKDE